MSIRCPARLEHVTTWLKANRPDVLFLQELKGTEFPAPIFTELGYETATVTRKDYNGVAILSLTPIETISTALAGDGDDTHARFLEMTIQGIRMVNIYLPNGNPVGAEKFAYKLVWMERLGKEMSAWLKKDVPVLIGGDFNVIPEDIDCHKPASWIHDALFQPEFRQLGIAKLSQPTGTTVDGSCSNPLCFAAEHVLLRRWMSFGGKWAPLATNLAKLPVGGFIDLPDYSSDTASRSRLQGDWALRLRGGC